MASDALHPAEAFLLGYLPELTREQFDALEILNLGRAGQRAGAPLLQAIDEKTRALPDRGPEVVSCVWELENLVGNKLKAQPPPPPRSGAELETWRAALAGHVERLPVAAAPARVFGGDGSLPGAAALGAALGRGEALLVAAIYATELLGHQRTHAGLAQRVADLAAARGAAVDALAALAATHAGTSACPTIRAAVDAAARALREAPLEAPLALESLGRQRAAYAAVVAAAREAEAALRFEPRAAIAAWRAGRLDGFGIRYAMLAHRTWSVPVALDDRQQPTPRIFVFGDKKVMFAFSDADAVARAPGFLRDKELLLLRTRGTWVFSILSDEIDVLTLDATDDPEHPGTINYQREQWAGLLARAAEAKVDEALCDWSAVDRAVVREHPRFWMAGPKLLTFPDGYGRARVAAFTSEAALEAALPPASPLRDEPHMVIPGKAFFTGIKGVQAAGFVVNPSGPGRSRAFNLKFAELLAGG
jgi:hypothetical protein